MKPLAAALLLFCATSVSAQIKAVSPKGATTSPSTLSSSGVLADGYLYVSGQGPRRPDGGLPADTAGQIRQALDNVKAVVEATGLTMEHVVYLQIYLENIRASSEVDRVFADYFLKSSPARAIVGVARVPEPPIEITAVAVQDSNGIQPVCLPNEKLGKGYARAVLTHDRLFVSAAEGRDPATGKVPDDPDAQVNFALGTMKDVVESAGLKLANMVFVNPYLTHDIPTGVMNKEYASRFEFGNTPGRATIQVSSLPDGAHIAYTGVAVRDLSQRHAIRPKNMPPSPTASPCVFAGDTLYCSAKSGFIPGPDSGVYAATTSHQAHQTMRNQLDNLEEAEMKFDQVVFTTVYLDDLSDMPLFEKVYRKYFTAIAPARVNVEQIAPRDRKPNADEQYPDLEQMSLIAVRTHPK